MNLHNASHEWATRPMDERFWTITEARDHAREVRAVTCEGREPFDTLRLEAVGEGLTLRGESQRPYAVTNWAFGQLCQRVEAPASYMRTLPAPLAADNLNHGLRHAGTADAQMLLRADEEGRPVVLRALTSDYYSRLWDADVLERCIELEARGWRVPPARPARAGMQGVERPATAEDVLRGNKHALSVKVGDPIAPAGIYLSDRDMFVFLIDENTRVSDGTEAGLMRGVFVMNSEVGASSLRVTCFLFRSVCGNHIVWGARNVVDVRLAHRGNIEARAWTALRDNVQRYLETSASEEENVIRAAKRLTLGATQEAVVEAAAKVTRLSARTLTNAYRRVQGDVDGDPTTAWGMTQGLTRYSQLFTRNQDQRDAIDRAAGRLVELAA